MSRKFHATPHQRGDVCYLELSGVIDEDNDLAAILEEIRGRTVVVHLGEVERVNSYGVRDWVNWLGKLEEQKIDVVLLNCSPAVVAQVNLVRNFIGHAAVKSFHVPYFCAQCDEEKVLRCETAEMGPPPHEPPICRCDECDLVMEFDDMPDTYFAFLARELRTETDSRVVSVIEEIAAADGEKSRIQSRVTSASGAGTLSRVASSLPSVPSLPLLDDDPAPPAPAPRRPRPRPAEKRRPRSEEAVPATGVDAEQEGRGGLVARVLIVLVLLALAALAYVLFIEP